MATWTLRAIAVRRVPSSLPGPGQEVSTEVNHAGHKAVAVLGHTLKLSWVESQLVRLQQESRLSRAVPALNVTETSGCCLVII